ncbi:MAG: DMT family transporter [Alphaproteobacteria bacterium]|nr:DMT family transporter [Alphaproteobacteria bacterium]
MMVRWRRFEPLLLLFAAGGFVGLIFPMAKLAGQRGLSPLTYTGLSAAGAAIVLWGIARVTGQASPIRRGEPRYALIAGQFTFAIPFGTLVAIIPLAGSGVPAILQSLAPLITLGIVYAIGFERPSLWRSIGLAIGFAGVLLILFSRGAGTDAESGRAVWYLVALITPLSLAVGNVYRSTAWPEGSTALPLATLTLAAAAPGLLILAVLFAMTGITENAARGLGEGWPLILLQSLFTGIGYAFFFRLQQVGGPVYLSQISYVNTGVGLIFAVAAFGERLPLTVWAAVAAIFAGIALVTLTKKPEN